MRAKKGAATRASPTNLHREPRRGIDDQLNALEQERLRSAVSERLIESHADQKQELAGTLERNRRRIERLEGQLRAIPDAERTAFLATMHADLERLLAAYWFFAASSVFPATVVGTSVRDPAATITESLEPFSELLFG
jgi:hypothetical protein